MKTYFYSLLLLINSQFVLSQFDLDNENLRLLDLADQHKYINPDLSQTYLDSIEKPIEKSLTGYLSYYYEINGANNDRRNEQVKLYQNYLLAIIYAEIEENYEIAGFVALELFKYLYYTKKKNLAYEYLRKSEYYYKKSNDTIGLIDVKIAPAYAKLLDADYKESKKEILKNLNYYKLIMKDDAYYYLFALELLISNELELKEYKGAQKHYKEFLLLKDKPKITKTIYLGTLVNINIDQAYSHFDRKNYDSAKYYLDEVIQSKKHITDVVFKKYYNLRISLNKANNNLDVAKMYLDSLQEYQDKNIDIALASNLKISEVIVNDKKLMVEEIKKKKHNRWLAIFLLLILVITSIIFIKKQKLLTTKVKNYANKIQNTEYFKTQSKKMVVKTQNVEQYLKDIKSEIKEIATIKEIDVQQTKIKELYKEIHIKEMQFFNDDVSHLTIINQLNVDFSLKLKNTFPKLTDQDIVVCHYIYNGFKNKEIATFLKTSIRAVEGKRYRISKKINLDTSKNHLQEFLALFFKQN